MLVIKSRGVVRRRYPYGGSGIIVTFGNVLEWIEKGVKSKAVHNLADAVVNGGTKKAVEGSVGDLAGEIGTSS